MTTDSVLYSMSDNALDHISRLFFTGTVPPKKKAVAAIEKLYGDPEYMKTLEKSIDRDDVSMISVISICRRCSIMQLASVFHSTDSRWTPEKVFDTASSLTYRGVLIASDGAFVINPQYSQLAERLATLKFLDDVPVKGDTDPFGLCNAEFIKAIASLHTPGRRLIFRSEYSSLFPTFTQERLVVLFETMTSILKKLEILDRNYVLDLALFRKLSEMNTLPLLSLLLCINTTTSLREKSLLFYFDLLNILKNFTMISEDALKKMIVISGIRNSWYDTDSVTDSLITFGIIRMDESTVYVNDLEDRFCDDRIRFDSDLSVTYMGNLRFSQLYRFCGISKFDRLITYRFDRSRFMNALDEGIDIDELTERFSLNSNTEKQLRLMEKQHNEVKIYDQITIKVSQRVANLLDNLPEISSLVSHKLADCIYVVDRTSWRAFSSRLTECGIHVSALNIEEIEDDEKTDSFIPLYSICTNLEQTFYKNDWTVDEDIHYDSAPLTEKLNSRRLAERTRELFNWAIEKRNVLIPSQLPEGDFILGQAASGFDFKNKVNILKKNSANHNPLYVYMNMKMRCVEVNRFIPSQDSEPLVSLIYLDDGTTETIPVGKIFAIMESNLIIH